MCMSVRLMALLAGIVVGVGGLVSLVVSERLFETEDGIYVTIGHRTIALPDGSIGDLGTCRVEWGFLGLFCIATAASLAIAPRVHNRPLRIATLGTLMLSLAAVAQFAFNVSR